MRCVALCAGVALSGRAGVRWCPAAGDRGPAGTCTVRAAASCLARWASCDPLPQLAGLRRMGGCPEGSATPGGRRASAGKRKPGPSRVRPWRVDARSAVRRRTAGDIPRPAGHRLRGAAQDHPPI